jgi:5'-nucleotidase
MTLTGQRIYEALDDALLMSGFHVSGLTYTWDAALPAGSKVVEVRKGDVAIDKGASYTVALDNLVTGTAISKGTNVVDTTISPTTALVTYVKSLPKPVSPPQVGRVQRLH